jgi:hypothetical protein
VLIAEKSFELANNLLNSNNLDEAMVKLEQALPCLLQLGNRISEAIISHLLHRCFQISEDNSERTDLLMRSADAGKMQF